MCPTQVVLHTRCRNGCRNLEIRPFYNNSVRPPHGPPECRKTHVDLRERETVCLAVQGPDGR